MKNLRKLVVLLLALSMFATLFAGCAKKDTAEDSTKVTEEKKSDDKKTEEKKSDDTAAVEAEEEFTFKASEEPITMTFFGAYGKNIVHGDAPIFMKAGEVTNVYLDTTLADTATDMKQEFNVMIASGEIADIVEYEKPEVEQQAMEGAFIPLEDLIAEHAPHLQAYFDANPKMYSYAKAPDGHLYYVPYITAPIPTMINYIRFDWLDKLDMEVPTNTDELYDVLTAFRNEDPNGNGQKDEVPVFGRNSKNVLREMMIWFDGARYEWYVEDEKVGYGPSEARYQTAVTELAKWYSEGLIDPEIFTVGGKARDLYLPTNLGGMTIDWFGSTAGYNDRCPDVEGFELRGMLPPVGTDGVLRTADWRLPYTTNGWAVSYSNENPVAAVKLMDWFFSEEGRIVSNYGIEGESFEFDADGNPQLTALITESDTPLDEMTKFGLNRGHPFPQIPGVGEAYIHEIAQEAMSLYRANEDQLNQKNWFKIPLLPEEHDEVVKIMANVETYRDEMLQKFILGAEPTDQANWDAYYARMEELGIDRVIEIHQTAWDRFVN